ncbi:hypothetical protein [Cupriavidus plantarum]|uniref:Cell division protein ZapB n=1 Tax=Cupriavidus plantarum TaxID=942865 RepID=A0A316EW31_9BURK|nr:hypothetical protein [Cupriavidus plantarum]NYH99217.1 putative nucleic acid-binding Zn-ribbon protein [Cupriavidus plantarum]PWK36456.1 hypothetical protein C7419_101312 [Cupriavidus plantarum]REF02806.1 hypothetical protein C7418_1627 [Cupriavidus plantarum]RLK44330.1 hypothetical protein C7417_0309 [Cupriavidus plantarum]CAG2142567.1 hypothetical protein LMG26296_03237 [Cupriavidus plantarum]
MLTELEQLAAKIGRVLHHADTLAAENQRLRAEIDRLQAEATQLRGEREAMAADRELLNIKIEEAQLRIQSILDKLPTASDARQLDLLGEPGAAAAATGTHPAPGEHA